MPWRRHAGTLLHCTYVTRAQARESKVRFDPKQMRSITFGAERESGAEKETEMYRENARGRERNRESRQGTECIGRNRQPLLHTSVSVQRARRDK